jgi:hypothetical protein
VKYNREDCKIALKKAKDKLDKSPTINEFNDLDISPSADTIIRKYGSWNTAKEAAGIEKIRMNNEVEPKPKDVEIPENKSWSSLSPYQRYYYKNRESEKKRTKKRTKKLKKWFKDYKQKLKCERCGEEHSACLDFHHEDEKDIGVSELVNRYNTSKSRIREEIEKCEVLCANCHRKIHAN